VAVEYQVFRAGKEDWEEKASSFAVWIFRGNLLAFWLHALRLMQIFVLEHHCINSAICLSSTAPGHRFRPVSEKEHPRAHDIPAVQKSTAPLCLLGLTVFWASLRQRTSQKMQEGTAGSPVLLHVVQCWRRGMLSTVYG